MWLERYDRNARLTRVSLLSVPATQPRARHSEAGPPHCDSQHSEGPLSHHSPDLSS